MGTDTGDRPLTWSAEKFTPFFPFPKREKGLKVIHMFLLKKIPPWNPPLGMWIYG